ncbi:DNA ligase 4-like [Cydia pomonella]|uniref:DNA ligase 4-like n=1 Tax=Cydia pomonella TaxID=82600 RepID=UPI002ADDFB8D|nr:DNA ligase 4-like [Cydia pomonella]
MPFAQLCDLLERLHKKKKERQEQDKILTAFFDEFRLKAARITGKKNCNLFPVMRLLLPALDRERGAYHLKETSLGSTLVRVLALPPTSPDALRLTSYRSVGNAQDSDLRRRGLLRSHEPPRAPVRLAHREGRQRGAGQDRQRAGRGEGE